MISTTRAVIAAHNLSRSTNGTVENVSFFSGVFYAGRTAEYEIAVLTFRNYSIFLAYSFFNVQISPNPFYFHTFWLSGLHSRQISGEA